MVVVTMFELYNADKSAVDYKMDVVTGLIALSLLRGMVTLLHIICSVKSLIATAVLPCFQQQTCIIHLQVLPLTVG